MMDIDIIVSGVNITCWEQVNAACGRLLQGVAIDYQCAKHQNSHC